MAAGLTVPDTGLEDSATASSSRRKSAVTGIPDESGGDADWKIRCWGTGTTDSASVTAGEKKLISASAARPTWRARGESTSSSSSSDSNGKDSPSGTSMGTEGPASTGSEEDGTERDARNSWKSRINSSLPGERGTPTPAAREGAALTSSAT